MTESRRWPSPMPAAGSTQIDRSRSKKRARAPVLLIFQFTVPRAQKALMNSPQAAHQTGEPRGEPVLNGFHQLACEGNKRARRSGRCQRLGSQ